MNSRQSTAAQAALGKYVRLFESHFPSGRALTKFLADSGCAVIWAQEAEWDQPGHPPWRLHFRLPSEYEAEFGFSRELLLLATSWREFQVRSLDFLKSEVDAAGRVDPEVAFIFCQDATAPDKTFEWCGNDFTVVALTPDHLRESPRDTLRKALQDNFYGRNFYDEAGVVTGERFFGRLNLLRKLTADVASGRPVGLFGLRRIGKTSVLRQLGETLDSTTHRYVYVDLQGSRLAADARHVLLVIARDLNHRMNGEFLDSALLEQQWAADRASLSSNVLDRLVALASDGDRQLVLALDELEVLLPTAASPAMIHWDDVLAGLRSMGQTNPRFSLILAGASPHVFEILRVGDRDNPVFQYGHPTYLGCMSERELERMVTQLGKRTGVFWAAGTIDRLYRATGGHPFLSRLVCSAVVQGLEPPVTVTMAHLESRLGEFLETQVVILSQVVESLATHYPDELATLKAFSAGTRGIGPFGPAGLGHLLGYDLVERTSSGIQVRIGLLEAWLRSRTS